MEGLVRQVLAKYNYYVTSAAADWSISLDGEDAIKITALAQLRAKMVSHWLAILGDDERFVVQKHLIEGLEWPRVMHEFSKRWDDAFLRSERALVGYQMSALEKIVHFCEERKALVLLLFQEDIIMSTSSKVR